MARTALPLTTMLANNGVNNPAATAIDQANGMVVTLPNGDIPADPSVDRLIFQVNNTFAGAKNFTVRAGANAQYINVPANRASLGDLVFSVGNAQTAYVGPFELSRFTQGGSPQTINIDFQSGMTGTILAIMLPRTV